MSIARNQSKTKTVLDLFPQGEKGVYNRMTREIRDGLNAKVKKIKQELSHSNVSDKVVIEAIAKKLYMVDESERLARIHNGKQKDKDVSYELFDRLEFPLDMSIHRVLGSPKELLSDKNTRDECLAEYSNQRMVTVGGVVQSDIARNRLTQDDKLELFATICAVKYLRKKGI
jgi:hypothetical protein